MDYPTQFYKYEEKSGEEGFFIQNLPKAINMASIFAQVYYDFVKKNHHEINLQNIESYFNLLIIKSLRSSNSKLTVDSLAGLLNKNSFQGIKINATKLATQLIKTYDEKMTQKYAGYTFPCNSMLEFVIPQMNKLNEKNGPYMDIEGTYIDYYYMYAAFLFCASQNYDVTSIANHKFKIVPKDKYTDTTGVFGGGLFANKPVTAFKKFLAEHPTLVDPKKLYQSETAKTTAENFVRTEIPKPKSPNKLALGALNEGKKYLQDKEPNYTKAIEFFKIAATHGAAEAEYYLGKISTDKDIDLALNWFIKAANHHWIAAYIKVGNIYDKKKNFSEAISWYKKGAELNDAECQFSLGTHYLYTETIKDEKLGFEWIKRAAQNEFTVAQFLLSELHLEHIETLGNIPEGIYWLVQVYKPNQSKFEGWEVDQGQKEHLWNRYKVVLEGTVAKLKKPWPDAYYAIGVLYHLNNENDQAKEWLEKAVKVGSQEAQSYLNTTFVKSNFTR